MAVSHKHTHTHKTHTHTNIKMHTCINLHFKTQHHRPAFLFCTKWRLHKVDCSAQEQQDRLRLPRYWWTQSHFILQDNHSSPCNCVGTAYAVSLFCKPIPRWHLCSLPSTLSGSTPLSFFRPSVSEFWICYMKWSSEEQTTQRKMCQKVNKLFTVYLSLL